MKRPISSGEPLTPLCADCRAPLCRDEIAITKRLVGRGIRSFFCVSCLASRLMVSEEVIRHKIEEFRAMGCALFPALK